MAYKYRYLQHNISARPPAFRAILITGPRRAGKSTLAAELQRGWGGGSSVSFDTPAQQARFKEDPEGFLRSLSLPAVLDEVQNVPELFQYLKSVVDEAPQRPCDYILTGSQQFQMMRRVGESLAGRILIKDLLPFSCTEAAGAGTQRSIECVKAILAQDRPNTKEIDAVTKSEAAQLVVRGGFPQCVDMANSSDREEWFRSYVETYVQRDVRALSAVHDLSSFSRFVSMIALKTAQPINYSEIGKDIGVSYKTAQHFLSILEASYLWRALKPFYQADSLKRLSKSPKGIILDSGLAAFLLGVRTDGFESSPFFGPLFETFVITEILKAATALPSSIAVRHFRNSNRSEVDLVLEIGARRIPIEIKGSATVGSDWGRGVRDFKLVAGMTEQEFGYVISLHPHLIQIAPGVLNIPLECLDTLNS